MRFWITLIGEGIVAFMIQGGALLLISYLAKFISI